MALDVKICGIMEQKALRAAIEGGAHYVGFVFCPPSRHALKPGEARGLALHVPTHVKRVGLFVDATNAEIQAVAKHVRLDMLQLHGNETPERVAEIRALTGLPVMVAIRIATVDHLKSVPTYEAVADQLLFDTRIGSEPSGGTGKTFDWSLLTGHTFKKPWLLAGGLNARNLAEAVRISGAHGIDVSSGVEDHTGHKNPKKIKDFLHLASQL